MRVHYEDCIRKYGVPELDSKEFIDLFLYQSYWYGALYVVIEGWQELTIEDSEINRLLAVSANVALLKRYRNGAFHFQKDYFDSRFIELMQKADIVNWIREIRSAFSKYFLSVFTAN